MQVDDSVSDNQAVGAVKGSEQTLQLCSCLRARCRGLRVLPHTHTHTHTHTHSGRSRQRSYGGRRLILGPVSEGFPQRAHSVAGPVTCSLMVCSHLPTTSLHLCPPHVTFISLKPSTGTAHRGELCDVDNIPRLFTFKLSTS